MEKNLKKGIDYTGVCVSYFCHDDKGNFVMSLRGKNARDENGRWDIGSGGLEFGQNIEDALRGEIKEEYSTNVISYEFLGYRDVHREHDGKKTHWIALDFKVLVDPILVKNGEPHKFDEVKWFTFETMPDNIHSQFPHLLKANMGKLL